MTQTKKIECSLIYNLCGADTQDPFINIQLESIVSSVILEVLRQSSII